MILTEGLKSLYAATIDRSKFREVATRLIVFVLPLFFWGREPRWSGIIIAAIGVLIRAWGAGYLKKDQEMAHGGPYLLVRHPLYLGSCILSLGLIVSLHHWFVTIMIGGVTLLQYWHTIRHEEAQLRQRFGTKYQEYEKVVRPLWPTPASIRYYFSHKKESEFSFAQYLKNKEYECLLGVVVVFVLLKVGAHH
ncbi:MAG: isoprenylcysteine carboxylmethyltransferase family protein [Bacteriovoracia bacterium]